MNQPRLTQEASMFLAKDHDLMREVSPLVGIKASGMESAVMRRSTTLTSYHAVLLISSRMGKQPHEIVELTE